MIQAPGYYRIIRLHFNSKCSRIKWATYGSNSWITLSNLSTEKSRVENAEKKKKKKRHTFADSGAATQHTTFTELSETPVTHRELQPWRGWAAWAACPASRRTAVGTPAWSSWRRGGRTSPRHLRTMETNRCRRLTLITWSQYLMSRRRIMSTILRATKVKYIKLIVCY